MFYFPRKSLYYLISINVVLSACRLFYSLLCFQSEAIDNIVSTEAPAVMTTRNSIPFHKHRYFVHTYIHICYISQTRVWHRHKSHGVTNILSSRITESISHFYFTYISATRSDVPIKYLHLINIQVHTPVSVLRIYNKRDLVDKMNR